MIQLRLLVLFSSNICVVAMVSSWQALPQLALGIPAVPSRWQFHLFVTLLSCTEHIALPNSKRVTIPKLIICLTQNQAFIVFISCYNRGFILTVQLSLCWSIINATLLSVSHQLHHFDHWYLSYYIKLLTLHWPVTSLFHLVSGQWYHLTIYCLLIGSILS